MIHLLLGIALVGLIVWLIVAFIPMPEPFKKVIIVVAIVFLIIYLMGVLGIADIPIPRIR